MLVNCGTTSISTPPHSLVFPPPLNIIIIDKLTSSLNKARMRGRRMQGRRQRQAHYVKRSEAVLHRMLYSDSPSRSIGFGQFSKGILVITLSACLSPPCPWNVFNDISWHKIKLYEWKTPPTRETAGHHQHHRYKATAGWLAGWEFVELGLLQLKKKRRTWLCK